MNTETAQGDTWHFFRPGCSIPPRVPAETAQGVTWHSPCLPWATHPLPLQGGEVLAGVGTHTTCRARPNGAWLGSPGQSGSGTPGGGSRSEHIFISPTGFPFCPGCPRATNPPRVTHGIRHVCPGLSIRCPFRAGKFGAAPPQGAKQAQIT